MGLNDTGYLRFPATKDSSAWAAAALPLAQTALQTAERRHGGTWAPGVDLLPNAVDGTVAGIPLKGPWQAATPWSRPWHRAQISAVWPGYPRQDPGETDAAHRYRQTRDAAHVDGLLPVGPDRRRFPLEFHAFILGLPLNPSASAPTVVWEGSHHIIRQHLTRAIGPADPATIDVTDAYHAARRAAFKACRRIELTAQPGEAFLIHRLALHGTAPWQGPENHPRITAFFRPEYADPAAWLAAD